MFPRTVSRASFRHHLRAQCAMLQARILAKPSVRMMLVMAMRIAKCALLAGVATCPRRPMHVFARCTACAMHARCARCTKWRSGPGPILLGSCARTLKSTRAQFSSYHSNHWSRRTGSPDAPAPTPGHVLARRPPESCILPYFLHITRITRPIAPYFLHITRITCRKERKIVLHIFFFSRVIRVICKK